ncbi:MAG: SDR family NAD(P)-dependent oxidoreductase [Betaproteobacteria bacterium]|nr:SDR family NAD(P)-dependent oxidoreductase [Betaproteobacteria bacterium]
MNLYVVTGTTKGLGESLAEHITKQPENLLLTLSRSPAEYMPGGLRANIHADFGDIAELPGVLSAAEKALVGQHFDKAILLNNAGVVSPVGAFERVNGAAVANNIQVNLVAPMLLMQWFANITRQCAASRLIVNLSSGAARRAVAGWSAYCAAKAGLEMATRVAAMEATHRDATLAICSLAPGVVDTPMQAELRRHSEAEFPDIARFRAMKEEGVLRPAADVARDILGLIAANRLANGGIYDLRDLQAEAAP